MVKQERGSSQCGLCTVAMLTDFTREEMLAAVPDYVGKGDSFWLICIHALGFGLQEDANVLMAKLIEVLEFVWPTGAVQEHIAVSIGKIVVLVPKQAGVTLRQDI
jgi:hypothetical protein